MFSAIRNIVPKMNNVVVGVTAPINRLRNSRKPYQADSKTITPLIKTHKIE